MSSPSSSPTQNLYYSMPQAYDTTSESSSPRSPPMMFHNGPGSYDMLSYSSNPSAYYAPQAGRIPVEYTGSSTLDDRDRRRRRASVAKDKENIPNMHLRRRAQNRASQRAFRERKEKHVKGLEHQLEDLHDKHQDLLQSYSRQADEVAKLNSRIHELSSEIEMLRTQSDVSFSELLTPEKFDAVPGSDMLYSGPEYYFDKGVMESNSDFSLNHLDDAL